MCDNELEIPEVEILEIYGTRLAGVVIGMTNYTVEIAAARATAGALDGEVIEVVTCRSKLAAASWPGSDPIPGGSDPCIVAADFYAPSGADSLYPRDYLLYTALVPAGSLNTGVVDFAHASGARPPGMSTVKWFAVAELTLENP